MEMILALKGSNFIMIACDTILSNAQALIIVKNDFQKYHPLKNNFLLLTTGAFSDVNMLTRFVKAEMTLHKLWYDRELTNHELVYKIKLILREHFDPKQMKVVAVYFDENEGPQIKVFNEPNEGVKSVDYTGQGLLGIEVCTSCIQPIFRSNLTEDQAYLILVESIKVLKSKVRINYPKIHVKMVSKDGITDKEDVVDSMDVS